MPNNAPNVGDSFSSDDSTSPVSWSAIIAGALITLSTSLALLALGAGLGLMLPWSIRNASITHLSWIAAAWMIVTQWLSSILGGYLTGRLRTKWAGVHSHEVFFRDTAHGFLMWSLATILSAAVIFSIAAGAGAYHAKGHAGETTHATLHEMDVDNLLRSDRAAGEMDQESRRQIASLLFKEANGISLSDEDKNYLAQAVSTHNGIDVPEAQKRIDDEVVQIRQEQDNARKLAASIAIFSFLSMLVGAFVACAAAALGGYERDLPAPAAR